MNPPRQDQIGYFHPRGVRYCGRLRGGVNPPPPGSNRVFSPPRRPLPWEAAWRGVAIAAPRHARDLRRGRSAPPGVLARPGEAPPRKDPRKPGRFSAVRPRKKPGQPRPPCSAPLFWHLFRQTFSMVRLTPNPKINYGRKRVISIGCNTPSATRRNPNPGSGIPRKTQAPTCRLGRLADLVKSPRRQVATSPRRSRARYAESGRKGMEERLRRRRLPIVRFRFPSVPKEPGTRPLLRRCLRCR